MTLDVGKVPHKCPYSLWEPVSLDSASNFSAIIVLARYPATFTLFDLMTFNVYLSHSAAVVSVCVEKGPQPIVLEGRDYSLWHLGHHEVQILAQASSIQSLHTNPLNYLPSSVATVFNLSPLAQAFLTLLSSHFILFHFFLFSFFSFWITSVGQGRLFPALCWEQKGAPRTS